MPWHCHGYKSSARYVSKIKKKMKIFMKTDGERCPFLRISNKCRTSCISELCESY